MRLYFLLCLIFIGLVICEPLNTVEGIWTESKYGGKIYICVDDTSNLWATYSEAGVLWGRASLDRTIASGSWYEAGNNVTCTSGLWQAIINQDEPNSLVITYVCEENPNDIAAIRTETRLSNSANNNDCNVVTQEQQFTGTWGNKLLGVEDYIACSDGNEGQASIVTDQETFVYVYGAAYENDRIFTGQWFSDETSGIRRHGSYLFFPINTQEAVQIFWTGDEINYERDINDPRSHRIESGIQYRGNSEEGCDAHSYLVEFISESTITKIPIITILLFVFVQVFLV